MKRSFAALAGLALLAGLPGGQGLKQAAAEGPAGWGTVKGQVVFGGDTVPERKEINVDKDQAHCLSKGKLYSQEWVVNKENKGVRWVFMWLRDADPTKKLPINPALSSVVDTPAEMDQPCCQFEPHCLGLQQGEKLIVKNSSPITHNVNWTGGSKNPGGNVIMPPGSKQEISNLKASNLPVSVTCNIHPWMKAYIRVFDHPYFAVTDADGNFQIKDAPAGTYRLISWQEAVGWGPGGKEGREVEIKPGGVTDVGQLQLKPSE